MCDKNSVRKYVLFFLGVLLFYWGTVGVASIVKNSFYGEIDTVQYLREAKAMAQNGGFSGLLIAHLKGAYAPTGVVQPLFPLILSYAAVEGVDFYVRAKLITALIGFLALWVSFLLLKKEFGFWEAVLAVTASTVSAHVLFYFTIVAVEPLFMLSTMLAWFAGLQALRTRSLRWSFMTGSACLAVYLCKGYGYFLLGAWLLAFVWRNPKSFWKERCFYYVPLSFLFVGLPVFINNMIQHHTPLYTSQSALIWVDDFLEFYTPDYQRHGASFSSYLQTRTWGHLFGRHLAGAYEQFRLIGLLARPVFAPSSLQSAGILLLAPLAALGWRHDADKERKSLSLLVLLAFFFVGVLTVSVYNVTRIYIPFLPVLLVYAVCGVLALAREGSRITARALGSAALILLIAMGLYAGMSGRMGNPLRSAAVDPDLQDLQSLLELKVQDGERIFWAPSHSSLLWTSTRLMNQNDFLLLTSDWGVINAKAEQENIRWLVVDRELFRRYNALFTSDYVALEAGGLRPVADPPGWKRAYSDQNPPSDWILYRRDED